MKISNQRIEDLHNEFESFRYRLERLHKQGEVANGCNGWPECDCRLAEQIRIIVLWENSWQLSSVGA